MLKRFFNHYGGLCEQRSRTHTYAAVLFKCAVLHGSQSIETYFQNLRKKASAALKFARNRPRYILEVVEVP